MNRCFLSKVDVEHADMRDCYSLQGLDRGFKLVFVGVRLLLVFLYKSLHSYFWYAFWSLNHSPLSWLLNTVVARLNFLSNVSL